jgi:hypothetical protein
LKDKAYWKEIEPALDCSSSSFIHQLYLLIFITDLAINF